MPKVPPKDYYASMLAPGTKKIAVVSRRLGTKERFVQIAVCTHEGMADKIVEALNLLQGEVAKLEAPTQRVLDETKAALASERLRITELSGKLRVEQESVGRLKIELRDAIRERDAAQKHARETASVLPQG